jgi:hypothetical protein
MDLPVTAAGFEAPLKNGMTVAVRRTPDLKAQKFGPCGIPGTAEYSSSTIVRPRSLVRPSFRTGPGTLHA